VSRRFRVPKQKIPKHSPNPQPQKRPKAKDPEIDGFPLAWRFSGCDKSGPFSWAALVHGAPFKEVMDRLHEFETKQWPEIIKTGSHPIEVYKCEKSARDRLADIQQDDLDELMSFRISGTKRVWCIKDRNIMRVLWWDPDHKVCPAHLKHT
jgi:hypothetical protein